MARAKQTSRKNKKGSSSDTGPAQLSKKDWSVLLRHQDRKVRTEASKTRRRLKSYEEGACEVRARMTQDQKELKEIEEKRREVQRRISRAGQNLAKIKKSSPGLAQTTKKLKLIATQSREQARNAENAMQEKRTTRSGMVKNVFREETDDGDILVKAEASHSCQSESEAECFARIKTEGYSSDGAELEKEIRDMLKD
jgi:seryl-tRNA synthetase